jgi:hypothetical protein
MQLEKRRSRDFIILYIGREAVIIGFEKRKYGYQELAVFEFETEELLKGMKR